MNYKIIPFFVFLLLGLPLKAQLNSLTELKENAKSTVENFYAQLSNVADGTMHTMERSIIKESILESYIEDPENSRLFNDLFEAGASNWSAKDYLNKLMTIYPNGLDINCQVLQLGDVKVSDDLSRYYCDVLVSRSISGNTSTGSRIDDTKEMVYRVRFKQYRDNYYEHGRIFYSQLKEKEKPVIPISPPTQDKDGDGILDSIDKCPEEAGTLKNEGCPNIVDTRPINQDRDGDGILDVIDKCPDEIGTLENRGCPPSNSAPTSLTTKDSDGDGLIDSKDNCPNEAGSLNHVGCPDSDGDSIIDKYDECPNKKGDPKAGGCPDSDGDGLPDQIDKCPDIRGEIKNAGCPDANTARDSDGDGLPDQIDKCPDIRGERENAGCPDADRDRDGLPDQIDKCPDIRGEKENAGCPGILTDTRDGQTYRWMRLKDGKKWMTENLNYMTSDSWCYDNKESNCYKYGRLYTWEAAKTACPDGWYLPSDNDLFHLASKYGEGFDSTQVYFGKKTYKSLIQNGYSGFSARLGGFRDADSLFKSIGDTGIYWSSKAFKDSNAFYYNFQGILKNVSPNNADKKFAFSCRCVQD